MLYKVINKRTGAWAYHTKDSLIKAFECDTFNDNNCLRSDYELYDEDIKELIDSNPNYTIYDNEDEYLKDMVEHEEYCSPRGIESLYTLEKEK